MADALDLTICNTWFKKDDKKLVSYQSGVARSTIDYILLRQSDKRLMRNAKIICGEECVPKHQLLVVDLKLKDVKKSKIKFTPKLKVWQLSTQPYKHQFAERVRERKGEVRKDSNVNDKWIQIKTVMRETAEDVVGWTKGRPRHKET